MTQVINDHDFWREVERGKRDFSGFDLSQVNFPKNARGINWREFVFTGAKFKHEAEFNRGQRMSYRDFSGIKLDHLQLSGFDAGMANFGGADFSGSQLDWAYFCLSDLSQANFTGANLYQGDFVSANLTGATLVDADLRHTTFTPDCNLTNANLTGVSMTVPGLFNPLRTKGMLLERADLRYAQLKRGNFRGVSFAGSDLRGTVFNGANLCGANFRGALFDINTSFDGAYADDTTIWPKMSWQIWRILLARHEFKVWTKKEEAELRESIKKFNLDFSNYDRY